MSDPNNELGNPNPTHINAFYADLADAKQELAKAQGRVTAAEQAVRDNGGVVPGEEEDATDVVVDGDEAQLKQDEAQDVADDASEPVESDAPVAGVPAEPVVPEAPAESAPAEAPAPAPEESPAEEAAEPEEESAPVAPADPAPAV